MKTPLRLFVQSWRVGLVILLAMLLDNPIALFAHPEGPAHHNPLPAHATDVMRAFQQDQQPPENLQALGFAGCDNGWAANTYPCSNVDLLAFLPLSDIGGVRSNSGASDIWGWTDPSTGNEYAIIGRVYGTSFVDISVPSAPVYLGELPTHGPFGSSWRDIKVRQNHAFIVSEATNHGMQVFDLTQLRTVISPPVTFDETAHYGKVASAHNIAINEESGYAYIVGASGKNSCSGGLHMVDIRNPTAPSFAGCFSADGYTHDTQCVIYTGPDAAHSGNEICINSNEDTLTIADVTDKNNPVQLSRTTYPGAEYTHQGWLTDDQKYFLVDDELDERNLGVNTSTLIWDLSDLENPILLNTFVHGVPAIDHNQYIKGTLSYQANYRAGLRILDISSVATPSEVAYFDIYPSDDLPEFNGAWSNYPYFASGVVVVSGVEQGLFILEPKVGGGPVDTPPTVTLTDPADGATVGGTVTITATATDDNNVTGVDFLVDGTPIGTGTLNNGVWSVPWDTTTVSDGSHVLTATATDTLGQTSSDSHTVTVDNGVGTPEMHVGNLNATATSAGPSGKWNATVTITIHSQNEASLDAATVSGSWSSGGSGSCTTNTSGQCAIAESNIHRNTNSVDFTITNVTRAGYTYAPGTNHDPGGSSVTVNKP